MPSPFPGMDPYIEQSRLWVDFHSNLASEIQAELNRQIRPVYFARLTPYTTYEAIELFRSRRQAIRPDVGVMREAAAPYYAGDVAVLDPPIENEISMDDLLDFLGVEILRSGDEQLITAIEILSPVNKRPGHDAHWDYRRKRRDLLHSDVHFLEIDLLRGGERSPLERPVPVAPYYVSLSRVGQRPFISVWPISLSSRLPTIPVPLAGADPDAILNLGQIVASVYERGGYDAQIDYRQPVPPPALTDEEAAWVDRLLNRQNH
ncbi:MAG: DUF4058 family protein [Chloroflexi bacterium]|nr:MAG: DUF4058 family protein [Chloroflexota bacterium]